MATVIGVRFKKRAKFIISAPERSGPVRATM